MIKNQPRMQETLVGSLDCRDPLEKKMQPILAFLLEKSHGQRSLISGLQAMGSYRVKHG